ncbi:hypothetical protein FBU30_009576 [Linnemannia zychae]|nr:hypothetical protein FBU30_009576 [Linnemannia zychae]
MASFVSQLTLLQSEVKKGSSVWEHPWAFFLPCWCALLGSVISMFPFFRQIGTVAFAGGDSSPPSAQAMVDNFRKFSFSIAQDITEKILLGTMAFRFGLLCLIVLLSITIRSGLLDPTLFQFPSVLFNRSLAKLPKADKGLSNLETVDQKSTKNSQKKKPEKKKKTEFKRMLRNIIFSIRMSYPSGNLRLQVLYFVKLGIMVFKRVIVFYTPRQTERLIRAFSQAGQGNGAPMLSTFDVTSIVSYVLYDYLQRYSSVLSTINAIISTPVNDYIRNSMTLRFFEHVHSLSMDYHLNARSSETMPTLSSGEDAIFYTSETILYYILPSVLDLFISLVYFWYSWGWKYGLIIATNIVLYIFIDRHMSKWRSELWRKSISSSNKASSYASDSLQNFDTVKYFSNEANEVDRYRRGIEGYKAISFKTTISENLFSMPMSFLWSWNLLLGCGLCAYEISQGKRDPSSFMTFVLHSKQLEDPVDMFGWIFSVLGRYIISIDELFAILEKEPTVKDIPNAPPLQAKGGEIEFKDVSFQYGPDKKGLSNVSFKIPKGWTVGIVGPTGSGKSTLLRLIFRLWDPTSGQILIDGQDISKVSQVSVRQQIGVVPQDTTLLDESILYNIGYARPSATRAEIEEAAKAAQIHDNIMAFEDKYETCVGERGAKLSGGERQRISIARVVLKQPSIVLLDEATSALDSSTESEIQKALKTVTQNRTTFVIAHRLSTVMHADLILYIKDGRIVERGTHKELVRKAMENGGNGEYYQMWRIQSGDNASSNCSTVGDEESDPDTLKISSKTAFESAPKTPSMVKVEE